MTTARIPEKEWQRTITDAMSAHGWRWVHVPPSRRSETRWTTAIDGSGRGWPDLFAARDDRAVAFELKAERGRVTEEQAKWIKRLSAVSGIEAHVIRLPRDLDFALGLLASDPEQLALTSTSSSAH